MSTRANIVIKDSNSKLYFYRHSDGYPDGARPLLDRFMTLVTEGKIRNNVGQSAGWLVLLGAMEYDTCAIPSDYLAFSNKDWKCGAMEPTTGIHGDIDWFYVLDLTTKTVEQYESDSIPEEYTKG